MTASFRTSCLLSLCLALLACGDDATPPLDAATPSDLGPRDAAPSDAGTSDAALRDAAMDDAGSGDAGVASICPAGSESLVLTLTGVTLARVDGVPIADGFAPGYGIVEGPVWARGALYLSHFGGGPTPASRIYRVDAAGVVSIAATNSGTNGLALGPDGSLYGARHSDGTVGLFDWADLDAAPTPVAATYLGARFNSPNDLVVRSNGTLYFTDPGWQAPSMRTQTEDRAYVVAGGSAATPIVGAPMRPNGIALSRDERTLYISGTNGLRRFDLDAEGNVVSAGTNVPAVSGGLDGLGRDCAGNLYLTGNDRVVILDPTLTRLGELSAPGATNVAFGGADRRTLFVTTLGTPPGLLSAELDVPGYPD